MRSEHKESSRRFLWRHLHNFSVGNLLRPIHRVVLYKYLLHLVTLQRSQVGAVSPVPTVNPSLEYHSQFGDYFRLQGLQVRIAIELSVELAASVGD